MSKNRKYVLVGASVMALVAAGGATASGSTSHASSSTPAQRSHEMGMPGGVRSATMMKQLDAAGVSRMMSGMSVHLSGAELKAMTDAHNAMVGGMMSDNMMSNRAIHGGR
ncbi:MAG: hypothetical protein ACR2LV_10590 [Solirubrobacteraceae bacterium]